MRSGWFMLGLGLIAGMGFGYVMAELQRVPPSRVAPAAGGSLPHGHPPVAGADGASEQQIGASAIAELEAMLAQSPNDSRLMVLLGDAHFEASDWNEARQWYERALAIDSSDPDVMTDLAVAYRRLGQPEKALELLKQAIALSPDHWQAWYNTVVILHFDLHRHEEARQALSRLQEIAKTKPVPSLADLERGVLGH